MAYNPNVVSLSVTAAAANGLALSQKPAAAGNLVLAGALVSAGIGTLTGAVVSTPSNAISVPSARRVAIASDADDHTIVFTVTGTDRGGNAITDTITGVNANSVGSVLDFATVSKIAVSGATTGNITAGTNNTASTPWLMDDFFRPGWYLSIAVAVPAVGAPTFTVEHTYDDPNANISDALQTSLLPGSAIPPTIWSLAALAGKSANTEAQYANQPIFAHRLTVTAGQGAATMWSISAGLGKHV